MTFFVDFVSGSNDKGGIGDVEIFDCDCLIPVNFPCDSIMAMVRYTGLQSKLL